MLRIYGDDRSGNCYKLRLILAQLNRPHEWIDTDIFKGASRTADYLAKNPAGQVPLLELAPGRTLPESNAILIYLAEGTKLWPTDPFERAQALRWMFFEQYLLEPNLANARFVIRFLNRPPDREEALKARIAQGHKALGILNAHLAKAPFAAGEFYSAADIALFGYAHLAEEGDIALSPYPAVRAWIKRVEDTPGYVPMTNFCPAG
jgi:glutathione S-transferase